MRTPTLPEWTQARNRCQQKGPACTVERKVQMHGLTWKAPDERLLAIERVDAAGFLVELTDAVLAVKDADEPAAGGGDTLAKNASY